MESSKLKTKSIGQINQKIEDGEANVYTIEEFKKLISDGDAPSFEEVDVVTAGTCGVMSGTAAILNFIVSEPGEFIRAREVFLNGIPAYPGPCPNEWLGSIDVILHGTTHSVEDHNYGGGFLLKEMLRGNDIDVRVESVEGKTIENTITIDDIGRGQIIGTRMAFKNYTAFVNSFDEPVSSIFSGIPLEGKLSGLTFSGCGALNPLQNDVPHNVIKDGCRFLLNGAEGYILGDGTRSSVEKPNLMLTADYKQMDPYYIGGYKTGEGGEVYDTVAIPIPVINEEVYNNLLITDADVKLPVAEIKGRHLPVGETNYHEVWKDYDLRPKFDDSSCSKCEVCQVESVCPTNAFKDRRFDVTLCFGCGLCSHYCRHGAFDMNTGDVDLEINGETVNIPIVCRQSDRLRGNRLSLRLKQLIESNEFKL